MSIKAEDYFPETDFNVEPVGPRIVVQMPKSPETTRGGVFLPDSIKETDELTSNWGKVVAMGPDCFKDTHDDVFHSRWCEVGDYVEFPRFQVNKVKKDGVYAVIIDDALILNRIKNPVEKILS